MEIAFEIIKKNDGITTDDNYPYEGIDGKCDAPKDNGVIVTIDGHEDVPGNDENALLKAVANHVSVASDGGSSNFLFYSKGVFTGFCRTELNHGVAAVGYGSDSHGRKNWIVRNSWRPECGEKGYIKIERKNSDSEGRCSIAMEASYSYPIKLSSCNPSKDADLKDEL